MLGHVTARWRSAERLVLRALAASSHAAAQEAAVAGGASFSSSSAAGAADELQDAEGPRPFDAAEYGAPLRVHQLIGDPRTGIADDTTTAPFGDDVACEWIWSSPSNGVDWFRYSLAGDQLPFIYMDSRLSDHSKNLMYLLRCKDPRRWTIEALADKFRVRRQRVAAILALKEVQAHRMAQGAAMQGALQPFVLRVPLADLHLQPADGEPLDLLQLVRQQEALHAAAAAAAGAGRDATPAPAAGAAGQAEGLGSLEDFLAAEGGAPAGSDAAAAAAAGPAAAPYSQQHQADLAVLMPQLAVTAQQLQLQLLGLLERHSYSVEALQASLLQQVELAEAYYNAHIAGTPLEQVLLLQGEQPQPDGAAAAAPAAEAGDGGGGGGEGEAQDAAAAAAAAAGGAAAKPAWLDFDAQRQHIQQLLAALQPLLANAGVQQARDAGQLLARLTAALLQHEQHAAAAAGQQQEDGAGAAADAAAASSDAEGQGQQQEQQQQGEQQHAGELAALVAAADAASLARAYAQLAPEQQRRLLAAAPEARIVLNTRGVDLRGATAAAAGGGGDADAAEAAAGAAPLPGFSPPGAWPGEVPPLVDVWGFEELPRQQLAAVQQQLPGVQRLLQQLDEACAALGAGGAASGGGSGGGAAAGFGAASVDVLQQAVQVYCGVLHEYDKVLWDQAAAASGAGEAPKLGPSAQRRLMRILRELDPAAIDKLLLWESYMQAAAKASSGARGGGRLGPRVLNRLRTKVLASLKALDEAAAAAGRPGPYAEYPDLPAATPRSQRMDKDLGAARLEATVVGRQFHRGSGDRHYVRVATYPKFEGVSLEEFDATSEGEISIISRLAAEREDNMMWKEFRQQLLRNIGLLGPDLHLHVGIVKPPKPAGGWSWVVHPVGGAARALRRQQLKEQARRQWLGEDAEEEEAGGRAGTSAAAAAAAAAAPPPADPAREAAPATAYVAQPDGTFRGLNEGEALLVGDTVAKPRRRWYASTRR